MTPVDHGVYLVSDSFFQQFPSSTWMQNKSETRPHYYAVQDSSGLYWMIPMSSKVDKYRRKIQAEEAKHGVGNCVYYHLGNVYGRDSAFVISGCFPVTEQYILRGYEMYGAPVIVQNRRLNQELRSRVVRFIRLLEQHKLRDDNHVLNIRRILLHTP